MGFCSTVEDVVYTVEVTQVGVVDPWSTLVIVIGTLAETLDACTHISHPTLCDCNATNFPRFSM